MTVSVIICTRNRAVSLDKTLAFLQHLTIPAGLVCEILVVDNGSTDGTPEVVQRHAGGKIPVRRLLEPSPGLSKARNAGLAATSSEIILFTDDDVAPAKDWLERISGPLHERKCDAALGRVELSSDLHRPWLTQLHLFWLACCDGQPLELVGANMGFRRSVLDRVPAFDVELGAGALGFGEETLFSYQLSKAGLRLAYVPEASVVHYPDPSRLLRFSWLSASNKHGASRAYVMHHWRHEAMPSPRLRYWYLATKLALRRLHRPQPPLDTEGITPWEMWYVIEMAQCRHFLTERTRPRHYSKFGLVKHSPRA